MTKQEINEEIKELFDDYYDLKITYQELVNCIHDIDENFGPVIV